MHCLEELQVWCSRTKTWPMSRREQSQAAMEAGCAEHSRSKAQGRHSSSGAPLLAGCRQRHLEALLVGHAALSALQLQPLSYWPLSSCWPTQSRHRAKRYKSSSGSTLQALARGRTESLAET